MLKRIGILIAGLGTLAGALSLVPLLRDGAGHLKELWGSRGAVELPGTYPGEFWKRASLDDVRWLQDEWCYPALRGFISRFKIEHGRVLRQNQPSYPDSYVTEWEEAEVFKSNRGVLRLRYLDAGWNAAFIDPPNDQGASFRENERTVADDGRVSSTRKLLALSCRRCSLSDDGLTYSCDDN